MSVVTSESVELESLLDKTASPPLLIALSGFSQAGKDTVADYLVEKYGFVKVGFADGLKNTLSQVYGVPRHLWDDETWRSKPSDLLNGKTPRMIMQQWGLDLPSVLNDSSLWIRATKPIIRKHLQEGKSVVIKDVRFPAEYEFFFQLALVEYIKPKGASYVHIVRPGLVPQWVCKVVEVLGVNKISITLIRLILRNKYAHASELYNVELLKLADKIIYNFTTIDDLKWQIDNLMGEIQ